MVTVTIEGSQIFDIPSFYDEINRVFMAGEDWRLGPSLDAFDDMLYGGYGALLGVEKAAIIWRDSFRSKEALGRDATRQHYLAKLAQPSTFDAALIQSNLDALDQGTGPSYFEIVVQIITDHRKISLELQ